jgi:hypothetical protein
MYKQLSYATCICIFALINNNYNNNYIYICGPLIGKINILLSYLICYTVKLNLSMQSPL